MRTLICEMPERNIESESFLRVEKNLEVDGGAR